MMKKQDVKVGQMYVYRCKVRDRNCRVYRSLTAEYRVVVVKLLDRKALVELHYSGGCYVGQVRTVTKGGHRLLKIDYVTAEVGLRNLFPNQAAWINLEKTKKR